MEKPVTRIEAAILLQGGEKEHKKLFTRIWNYYYSRLFVYIQNTRLSDPPDDVVQEILTKVWMNLGAYNPFYSLTTWIYTIARNHIIDLHRKKRIFCTAMNDPAGNSVIDTKNLSPEDAYFQNLKKNHISRFISNLDEKDREITYLRFYEQIRIKNIAEIMKIPSGTVKYRIHTIKQKLSAFLEDENEEEKN